MSLATIVKGNTFSLAIPLQVYAVEDGEAVLRDYTPESGDNITIRLKGDRRNYTYIPSTNGSTAFIHLEGSEVVGVYAVEVEIVKDDDSKLTSMRFEQLSIVESIDELNEGQITEGIEQGAIYLDPEIFIAGEDGRGIVSIVKTATSGLVDTYTITYTDNTTSTFNVTNGADGQDGVGIASIAKTGTQGLVDTYTITMTNGTTYTYQVTNGKNGENGRDGADGQDGTDGVGIVSITKTSTSGLVDTYTILLTNGTTTTFTVTNGSDATQVQSDWSQSDSSAVDYIKNKPTNVSAFNNDAGYLNNNFCPIIEDTRSSAVAAITGVAPFSTLVDGQRIILLTSHQVPTNATLTLTLSGGTTTSALPMYNAAYNGSPNTTWANNVKAETYLDLIYESANNRWVMVGQRDTNTTYGNIGQSTINAGTETYQKTVSALIMHDNCYIVEETYSSGSLKANKFYDFGTVSSALTIPSLDATNDLVSNALNFYALRFIAGADNISITFPTGVIVDDTPTINTGDYVEIMINKYGSNFYASIKVWQAQ